MISNKNNGRRKIRAWLLLRSTHLHGKTSISPCRLPPRARGIPHPISRRALFRNFLTLVCDGYPSILVVEGPGLIKASLIASSVPPGIYAPAEVAHQGQPTSDGLGKQAPGSLMGNEISCAGLCDDRQSRRPTVRPRRPLSRCWSCSRTSLLVLIGPDSTRCAGHGQTSCCSAARSVSRK